MNILDTVMSRIGYTKTREIKDIPRFLGATAGSMWGAVPDYTLYENQARLYQQLSWVYSAVNVVAAYCATVGINVKRRIGDRTKDISNHPFEMLLERPNPLQSRYDLLYSTIAYYKLTGQAYWWLNRSSPDEPPSEIWILPPHRIIPVPDEKMYLSGYSYMVDAHEEILPLHQVMHFKGFHPTNEFVGMSGIEPIATVATSDLAAQRYNANLLGRNNGRLPGILGFADFVQEPTWTQLKEEIKNSSEQHQYMLLRGVGKGGVELIAAPTPKDMEFLGSRTFTKEEVYSVLAPGLASVLAVNATEANARTGKATLMEFTVWPMLQMVAQRITNDLLDVYGRKIICDFDDVRVTDRAMELSEQATYARTHTIDEVRDRYYQDNPLPDERGGLLLAQVAAGNNIPSDEPEPTTLTTDQPPVVPPEAVGEQAGEQVGEAAEEAADLAAVQAVKTELDRWRRKALNFHKRGKPANVEFETTVIPNEVVTSINQRLAEAKTTDDITAAFDDQAMARTLCTKPAGEFDGVIAAIRDGIKALDGQD